MPPSPTTKTRRTPASNNVYNFTVVVTDTLSDSPRLTATREITVTVEDIEEAGTITVDNLNPGVGDTIHFELIEPDGGVNFSGSLDRWQIQSRSSGGNWSRISVSLPQTQTPTYTVVEDDTDKEIRAVIDYTDRRGGNKYAESEPTMPVTADPIINAPPRLLTKQTAAYPGRRRGRGCQRTPGGLRPRWRPHHLGNLRAGRPLATSRSTHPPGSCEPFKSWTSKT